MDKDMLKLKKRMDGAMVKTIGKRCETTDIEDFPETDYGDPGNTRCLNCRTWERFDKLFLELWRGMTHGA